MEINKKEPLLTTIGVLTTTLGHIARQRDLAIADIRICCETCRYGTENEDCAECSNCAHNPNTDNQEVDNYCWRGWASGSEGENGERIGR